MKGKIVQILGKKDYFPRECSLPPGRGGQAARRWLNGENTTGLPEGKKPIFIKKEQQKRRGEERE